MPDQQRIYSVSALTSEIRGLLEGGFPNVRVEGEISNFRPASSGHCYFSLKDRDAVLSTVMFRNSLGRLDFAPADGDKVVAEGRISVYAQRGSYQLICESMQKAGVGELLALLAERKRRLAAEGLFDAERKKPLPRLA
jgi:exodeoxyribonuclease VII large subunit